MGFNSGFKGLKCLEYAVHKIITFNLEKKLLLFYRIYSVLEFILFTLLYSGGNPEMFAGDY